MTVNDERFHTIDKFWEFGYHSYIARSYVDQIHLSGAYAIFVEFDLPIKELDYIMDNIHGFILPGADARKFDDKGKPSKIQQRIMWFVEKAKRINDSGRYFPIMSECHGFQAILIALNGNKKGFETCDYRDGRTTHTV